MVFAGQATAAYEALATLARCRHRWRFGRLLAGTTLPAYAFGSARRINGLMNRQNDTTETKSVRTLRVGEQVRHILSEVLQRGDVHDETLASHMVSITEVRMSPDLRHATVFVKPLLGKDEEAVLKALRTNTAYLQREVAHRVKMKYVAKLKFLADESFDEGSHIDQLLRNPHVARDLTDDSAE
jgi:ribosome-binding factor A